MSDATDAELLERWHAGDRQAGQQLARAYFPRIRGYFLNKVPHIHEELVSRTFLRLVEKRDNYRSESSFGLFLMGIARVILLEYFRELHRDAKFDALTWTAQDLAGQRASTVLGKREQHRLKLEALRRLELAEQELLELYYWQQLSGPEIAALLQLKESTVHSRLRRARLRLAQIYAELEAQPHERDYEDGEIEAWMIELRGNLDDLRVEAPSR